MWDYNSSTDSSAIQWNYDSLRKEHFRLSSAETHWVYHPSGERISVDTNEDGPSSLEGVDQTSFPKATNYYPRINTSGSSQNCPWVAIAALLPGLLLSGRRIPTDELYARLEAKEIETEDGPAGKPTILAAAGALGDVKDTRIDGLYTKLRAKGVEEKTSFAVGVLNFRGLGNGHRIVGYYDGDWYRFTDWQTFDNGEDVTEEVKKLTISWVFWFKEIYKVTRRSQWNEKI